MIVEKKRKKKAEPKKEKRNSEAGNRTPVVRVTGGNTKPLYYFGTVLTSNLGYMRDEMKLNERMLPGIHPMCVATHG